MMVEGGGQLLRHRPGSALRNNKLISVGSASIFYSLYCLSVLSKNTGSNKLLQNSNFLSSASH